MLIFVTPASLRVCKTVGVTLSGCNSTPIPSVMIKCSWTASMISLIRSTVRAGVPPPKYKLVAFFFRYVDFRQDEFHGAENRYTGHIVLLNTEFCNKGRNCKCFCKMEYVRIVLNFDSQNRVAFDHTHFER